MDVERTMQFILESQARTSAKLEEVADRQNRAEKRMDRFDKSLDGIRKLIRTGMKLMVQIQQAERENKVAIKQLSQRIDAFVASMEKGRNGRGAH